MSHQMEHLRRLAEKPNDSLDEHVPPLSNPDVASHGYCAEQQPVHPVYHEHFAPLIQEHEVQLSAGQNAQRSIRSPVGILPAAETAEMFTWGSTPEDAHEASAVAKRTEELPSPASSALVAGGGAALATRGLKRSSVARSLIFVALFVTMYLLIKRLSDQWLGMRGTTARASSVQQTQENIAKYEPPPDALLFSDDSDEETSIAQERERDIEMGEDHGEPDTPQLRSSSKLRGSKSKKKKKVGHDHNDPMFLQF